MPIGSFRVSEAYRDLAAAKASGNGGIVDYSISQSSLEDVFLALVSEAEAAA